MVISMMSKEEGHREEVINVKFADLLDDLGIMSEPETIQFHKGKKRLPDIIIGEYHGVNVVIEAKIESGSKSERELDRECIKRIEEGIAEIVLGVIYPKHIRNVPSNKLIEELSKSILQINVYTPMKTLGWNSVDVYELSSVIKRAYETLIGEDIITEAVELLDNTIDHVSEVFLNFKGTKGRLEEILFGKENNINNNSSKKNKSNDNDFRIFRIASLILVNAMMFQETLSHIHDKIHPLRQVLRDGSLKGKTFAGEFLSQWYFIEKKIDFIPIFRVAQDVLTVIPASPKTKDGLKALANTAIILATKRAALRHDLMGRIFHRLLSHAKYYGAFYTKIPSATLLLNLTFESQDWGINWSSTEELQKLRIIDLACGTGTLLKAALRCIIDKHIKTSFLNTQKPNPDETHRIMLETSLWGFDVLASAIHIAATALAMHNPGKKVDKMNLFSLPLAGRAKALGSIEFAKSRKLQVQMHLGSATTGSDSPQSSQDLEKTGPVQAPSGKKVKVELPEFLHLCVMNPPFTRSVGGNLLFGGIATGTNRSDLQAKLKKIKKEKNLEANITAGLGSIFVAIAHKYLSNKGVLALVLPKNVLVGEAWRPTRTIFQNYKIKFIISSHEPHNWNFSESTKLSEVLLILSKLGGKKTELQTPIYINLWNLPKTSIEALGVVSSVMRQLNEIADLSKSIGTSEVLVGDRKFGEIITCTLNNNHKAPWILPSSFVQTDLCRFTWNLYNGAIILPGFGVVAKIPLVQLSKVVELGPDRRDIHDAFSVTSSKTIFPAFWGNPKEVSSISAKPNKYLNPLTKAKKNRPKRDSALMWSRAGTLMIPDRIRLNTNSVFGVVMPEKALSNVWWPTKWTKAEDSKACTDMEKRIALWMNSTLGLLFMLMQREETEGSWIQFPKAWYKDRLKIIDLSSLTPLQIRKLDELWDKIKIKTFLPFPNLMNDPTRKMIDDVICEILALGQKLEPSDKEYKEILNKIQKSIEIVRQLISREPILSLKLIDEE